MQEFSRDANYRHITCEKLTVQKFAGHNRVEISTDEIGGYIYIYDQFGNEVVSINVDANGDGHVESSFLSDERRLR